MPKGFGSMFWNGETVMTTDFLVPCTDDEDEVIYDTNSWGEYLRMQSHAVYGIIGQQKRNIIPIPFLRFRGGRPAVQIA